MDYDLEELMEIAESCNYGNISECIGEKKQHEDFYNCWKCPVKKQCIDIGKHPEKLSK